MCTHVSIIVLPVPVLPVLISSQIRRVCGVCRSLPLGSIQNTRPRRNKRCARSFRVLLPVLVLVDRWIDSVLMCCVVLESILSYRIDSYICAYLYIYIYPALLPDVRRIFLHAIGTMFLFSSFLQDTDFLLSVAYEKMKKYSRSQCT